MDTFPQTLLTLQVAISWGLVVLIWLVQLIIYPSLQQIPEKGFVGYHRWYVKKITWIVLPLMIGEATLAVAWLMDAPNIGPILSMMMVLLVWLSTFCVQVPIHNRLKNGKEINLIRRLVATNWIRTIAWSIKATIVTVAVIDSSMGLH